MQTFTKRLDLHLRESSKDFLVKVKEQNGFKSLNKSFDFIVRDYERAIAQAKEKSQKAMDSRTKEIQAKLAYDELKEKVSQYMNTHARTNELRVEVFELIEE